MQNPPAEKTVLRKRFKHLKADLPFKVYNSPFLLDCEVDCEVKTSDVNRKLLHPFLTASAGSDPANFYKVLSLPGLFIVRNAITVSGQLTMIKNALKEFSKPGIRCNLDCVGQTDSEVAGKEMRPGDGQLWANSVRQFAENSGDLGKTDIFKLRWLTLGANYEWSSRQYLPSASQMDPVWADVCQSICRLLELPAIRPEACIVNFYHGNHSMGLHIDDAEVDMVAPLVSLSLCQSSVFVASMSQDSPGIAVRLRSGDAVIMSGPSRKCVHGVAKILPDDVTPLLRLLKEPSTSPFDSLEESALAAQFIRECRININARQVAPQSPGYQTNGSTENNNE